MIKVYNGNNGNEFEITDAEDISIIVNEIKTVAFQKEELFRKADCWYYMTFINESGAEIDSFGILNRYYIAKENGAVYRCDGQLDIIGEYMDNLEEQRFPDTHSQDPDFPY